jgi:hypothetical protein
MRYKPGVNAARDKIIARAMVVMITLDDFISFLALPAVVAIALKNSVIRIYKLEYLLKDYLPRGHS